MILEPTQPTSSKHFSHETPFLAGILQLIYYYIKKDGPKLHNNGIIQHFHNNPPLKLEHLSIPKVCLGNNVKNSF